MNQILVSNSGETLSAYEQSEIENKIDAIIDAHRGNRSMISRLVFESISSLTASESRSAEIASQGFLKRIFGEVSGQNSRGRDEISQDLAKAQFASQQTLQKIAEQNLMTFELLTAVNNKLNAAVIGIHEELNEIYQVLYRFFKQTKSDLVQLSNRMDAVEKNVRLLNWLNSIEFQVHDGVEYKDLDRFGKLVCIARDFYDITAGSWTVSDLLLLRTACKEMNLDTSSTIRFVDFQKEILHNPSLKSKLGIETGCDRRAEELYFLPIASFIIKYERVNAEEEYVSQTVMAELETHGICRSLSDINLSITSRFVSIYSGYNTDVEINLYDLLVDLLFTLQQLESNESHETKSVDVEFEVVPTAEVETVTVDYEKIGDIVLNRKIVAETSNFIFFDDRSMLYRIHKHTLDIKEIMKFDAFRHQEFFNNGQTAFSLSFPYKVISDCEIIYCDRNTNSITLYNMDSCEGCEVHKVSGFNILGMNFFEKSRKLCYLKKLKKEKGVVLQFFSFDIDNHLLTMLGEWTGYGDFNGKYTIEEEGDCYLCFPEEWNYPLIVTPDGRMVEAKTKYNKFSGYILRTPNGTLTRYYNGFDRDGINYEASLLIIEIDAEGEYHIREKSICLDGVGKDNVVFAEPGMIVAYSDGLKLLIENDNSNNDSMEMDEKVIRKGCFSSVSVYKNYVYASNLDDGNKIYKINLDSFSDVKVFDKCS